MLRFVVCGLALLTCSACVSNVASPVSDGYRANLRLDGIHVEFPDEERIPDRYDRSVMNYLDSGTAESTDPRSEFIDFAQSRGGLTEESAGELLLEYLVQDEVTRSVGRTFRGDRAAMLRLDIVDTVFPNAATMMLVGEVIGIRYDFAVTETETGRTLIESSEALAPPVTRSMGAGGGLLGLALRGGEDRHLRDLENMASAIAYQLRGILTGADIPQPVAEDVIVYPLAE